MSTDRSTELLQKSMSFDETGHVTTTYADDYTIRGNAFVFEKNFTIASGGTLNILVDYSTYTPTAEQEGLIFIYPPQFSTTAGAVMVNVYRGTNYSGGTEFDAINPNTTASKTTSGTTFTSGATGSTKGTEVLNYLVGASSTNQNSGGGSVSGLQYFIRPNTDKTLVEIVNNSGEEITFKYGQGLYEI